MKVGHIFSVLVVEVVSQVGEGGTEPGIVMIFIDPIRFSVPATQCIKDQSKLKSRLPIDYKLPVVFGLVVNFGD